MAQADFFNNLDGALNKLNQARQQGIISIEQEEEHINNMLAMYDAINAKKAAGREWDLKTQSIWGNLKRFAKEMAEDAENLRKAKKGIKKTEDEIANMGKVVAELERRGNREAAALVKKKKAQLEIEKEIQEVNYETAKSSVSMLGKAFNTFGKVGGFLSSNFSGLGSIFTSILGTIFNIGIELLKIIFPIEKAWKMFLEMQKVVGALAADIGMTYKEYRNLLSQMPTIYNEIVGYGGKIEDIGKIIKGFSDDTGKNRIFSANEIKDIVNLGYSTGLAVEGATKMVAEFDKVGLSLETTLKIAQKGRNDAARFNINQTKLLQTTTEIVKNLTGTSFGRSVDSLTKLAAKAESLRFNLAESIKSFKDAFFNPEKAVEAAAKIQVLGGEFAQMYGDPFQLMYDSMNNADGLAEKLMNTAKTMAKKGKSGMFEIAPADRETIRLALDALGQSDRFDDIVNAGIEQAKTADKMNALSKSVGSLVGISDDDQQALANLMTINKDGKYEIKMPNGLNQLVSNITSKDQLQNILTQRKANETAAQNRLTLQERLNIVLDRFAIGLTPLFEKLNGFLEDEGTLKKIEDLGKAIADKLIPFINNLFEPGGRLDKGIHFFLFEFNKFIDDVKGIMDGKGTFWEKIKGIFSTMVSFVTETILPYVQYIFGNIFKALKDIPVIGESLGLAGEQLIAKSFQIGKDKEGKQTYNAGTVGMAGGINEVNKLIQSANANKADAESNHNIITRALSASANLLTGTYYSLKSGYQELAGQDSSEAQRQARIDLELSGAQIVDAVGGFFDWSGKDEGMAGLFGYDQSFEEMARQKLQTTENFNPAYEQIKPVQDAMVYANGRYIKGGPGDAVAFLDEIAFGKAYKNSMGGGSDTTVTVNVSGVVEHDTPNGKKTITAKELYDSDPQIFGEFIKATMNKNGYGSANYKVDFGVVPL